MSTNVPFNANPLASNPSTYIPFDITRPAASRTLALEPGAILGVTLPEEVNLLMVVGSGDFTLVDAPNLAVVDGWEVGAFRASSEIYYNFLVGKEILLRNDSAEVVEIVINCQTVWSALGNLGTYTSS